MGERRFRQLAELGLLDLTGFQRALKMAGLRPTPPMWRKQSDLLLLVGGVLMLLSGIVSFFAWNWNALPGWAKLALVLTGLLLAATASFLNPWDQLRGQWSLFASVVMIGVVAAVVGQVYQTGADPWQLFALWAVLGLPWTVLARFQPLWFLWLCILSLSLWLWQSLHSNSAFSTHAINMPMLLLHTLALWCWESWRGHLPQWQHRIVPRLLGVGIAWPCTLALWSVAGDWHNYFWMEHGGWHDGAGVLLGNIVLLPSLLWLVGGFIVYYRRKELFMVTLPVFSAGGAILIGVGSRMRMGDTGTWFILAVLSVGMSIGAVKLLRQWHGQWSGQSEAV